MSQEELPASAISAEAMKNASAESLPMVKVGTVQTLAPDEMHAYINAIAGYYFSSMAGFHKFILKHYLEEQPWKLPGWVWHKPNCRYGGGITTPNTGLRQHNITVPVDILEDALQVHREIKTVQPHVSLHVFMYTMLIWGIAIYFPPKKRVIHAGPDVDNILRQVLN